MLPRLSIIAGLVAGVAVAGLVIGGILYVGVAPAVVPTPTPIAIASPSPSVGASTEPSPSAGPSVDPSSDALSHIGQEAPALVVPRVGGGTIDLSTLRGKAVWVHFMTPDCAACRDEVPLIKDFAARYAENGLVVVAIDLSGDEARAASFANELGVSFPIGLDADGSVAGRWGAAPPPVDIWIDPDGVVRDAALGGLGPDRMAAGLTTILSGVEVTPPESPSPGTEESPATEASTGAGASPSPEATS